MAETGFLIIADISGYTAFLTQTELDHAEDILNTLINKLVDSMSTMFIIAKLEGDAVFAYAPKGSFKQAQTLVECVENIYCAFAQTQRDMKLNTTCTCEACRLIPSLDLKIVLHHGQYMFSNIGGREELSGPDVILVHRLLKSTITEKAGVEAYVFFSEACEEVVDLSSLSLSMQRHEEEYEHLGVVGGCIYN
ncbi:MAG TPA: DUF2652 domain-containing protein, partial [Anaerolineae bacterium]|nr:DUF2652 domain-containing protein [Anaerolineae bacterium]